MQGPREYSVPAGEALLHRPIVSFDENLLRERLSGRRIVIAGAGGSVGRGLAEQIAALSPESLTLIESHEPSLFHLRNRLLSSYPEGRYAWVLADVANLDKLRSLFAQKKPEIVFNLAAYKHVPLGEENIDQVIRVNLLGTLRLLEAASEQGASAFVYPSTDKAVNPPSIYGATKRVIEKMLAAHALLRPDSTQTRVVRLVNVFGTQGSVIETFTRQLGEGLPLTITDSRMTRYWMTMREAAKLLSWVAVGPERSEPTLRYMLAVGDPLPLEETARRLASYLCPERPLDLRTIGIRPGERLSEELTYDFETFEPTSQPGVLGIRDNRGNGSIDREIIREVKRLESRLYSADSSELRRQLFDLATVR